MVFNDDSRTFHISSFGGYGPLEAVKKPIFALKLPCTHERVVTEEGWPIQARFWLEWGTARLA